MWLFHHLHFFESFVFWGPDIFNTIYNILFKFQQSMCFDMLCDLSEVNFSGIVMETAAVFDLLNQICQLRKLLHSIHRPRCSEKYCRSYSPYVRESTKVLDSGSQPLDSGSQHLDSGFQPSGFRIPNHCGFRILVSGFRIPTAKICWIPDSEFSYMGRSYSVNQWSYHCPKFPFGSAISLYPS